MWCYLIVTPKRNTTMLLSALGRHLWLVGIIRYTYFQTWLRVSYAYRTEILSRSLLAPLCFQFFFSWIKGFKNSSLVSERKNTGRIRWLNCYDRQIWPLPCKMSSLVIKLIRKRVNFQQKISHSAAKKSQALLLFLSSSKEYFLWKIGFPWSQINWFCYMIRCLAEMTTLQLFLRYVWFLPPP